MKIFAYGTLKKGGVLHKYMEGAKYVQRKKLSGYVLYLAPNEIYPLLYYTGNDKDIVVGEIWRITKKMKKILDKHEEGYVLKKLMKTAVMIYYPTLDITHVCQPIPKNKRGKYEFNVAPGYYKGFYKSGHINPAQSKQLVTTHKQSSVTQKRPIKLTTAA